MALVSIVVPVYYNAGSLPALAERLAALADRQAADTFEFIYVDDGSGDESLDVLRKLAAADPRIRVLQLSRNFGANAATLAGLTYARGDCVGYAAADLQDPPEYFDEMLRAWHDGAEVVLAVRRDRHGDPWATRLFAYGFNWLFKKLVFHELSPEGIGFFLIDRKVAQVLIQSSEKNSHLIGLVLWSGFRRVTVPYDRTQREHGASRWTFRRKIKYFIDAFVAFTYLPIRASSLLGLLLSLVGAVYAILVLLARLTGDVPVQGFTALIIVVLLAAGTQMLMLGVIGEYLWRTLDETRRRPQYIVASTIEAPLTETASPEHPPVTDGMAARRPGSA